MDTRNPSFLSLPPTCASQSTELSPLLFILHMVVYIWALLVAQMVKNLPAVPEIWGQSLDREDSPWTEEPGGYSPGVRKESDTTE